jgi:hypothetical protein
VAKDGRSHQSSDTRWKAVVAGAIAAAQAASIALVVVTARTLPASTRSAVVVVLSLLIWAEALWALYRVAAHAGERVVGHGDAPGGDGEETAAGERRRAPGKDPGAGARPLR